MGGTIVNCPYDLDLSLNAAHGLTLSSSNGNSPPDDPFGPAELERVLRPYDRDSIILPPRLVFLSGGAATQQKMRAEATTESWDNPCPAPALPKSLRTNNSNLPAGYPQHITDLLKARGITNTKLWPLLVAPEILAGLKLNINQPLGLPRGSLTQYTQFNPSSPSSGTADVTANFGYDPAGTNPGSDNGPAASYPSINPALTGGSTSPWPRQTQARQRLARYLYVLMLLLQDSPWPPTTAVRVQTPTGGEAIAQQQTLDTRRIAQWAINAVCFATNDSVMVPFKYDFNPLTSSGWRLQDDKIDATSIDNGTRGTSWDVVWGCKPPELLLTETGAFHDRGVADSQSDSGTPAGTRTREQHDPSTHGTAQSPYKPIDPDMDQVRVPLGSLFVELFCPRSPTSQVAPNDLYYQDPANGGWALDMARTASDGSPVWRIVVSQSRFADDPTGKASWNDVSRRLSLYPDSSAIEPEQYPNDTTLGRFSLYPGSTDTNVKIDRIIYLTPALPGNAYYSTYNTQTYYNINAASNLDSYNTVPRLLPAGCYVVLGPRQNTIIGTVQGPAGKPSWTPAGQLIQLPTSASQTVGYANLSGSSQMPAVTTTIKQPYGMVIGAPASLVSWTKHTEIGVSISEPLLNASYYPEPTVKDPNTGAYDWYDDPTAATVNFRDHPLETLHPAISGTDTQIANRPLVKESSVANQVNLLQTGTTLNYKTIFLQRLANPAVPYDPVNNPYRTVDWMPVNLTVFNGTDVNKRDGAHGWTDANPPPWMNGPAGTDNTKATYSPWDPDDATEATDVLKDAGFLQNHISTFDPNKRLYFATRQRGGNSTVAPTIAAANTPGYLNLWTQTVATNPPSAPAAAAPPTDPTAPPGPSTPAGSTSNFDCNLQNTLGYLNVAFWTTPGAPPATISARTGQPYAGDPVGSAREITPRSPGSPGTTAPTPAPGNC